MIMLLLQRILSKSCVKIELDESKALSSNRIFIEHLIRLLKIFCITSQIFCLRMDTYEQIILTICRLVRLRIGSLVLPN